MVYDALWLYSTTHACSPTVKYTFHVTCRDQGKYKEATEHLKDALAVREKVAPDNKPAVSIY